MYQPGSQAIYDVVEKFGSDILLPDKPKGEEEIDRKKLGSIVFSDPSAMSVSLCLHVCMCVCVCVCVCGRPAFAEHRHPTPFSHHGYRTKTSQSLWKDLYGLMSRQKS